MSEKRKTISKTVLYKAPKNETVSPEKHHPVAVIASDKNVQRFADEE